MGGGPPPLAAARWRLVCAILALAALPLHACARPEKTGLAIEVWVEDEAFRPDFVNAVWMDGAGHATSFRLPAAGEVSRTEKRIATLVVQIDEAIAGPRIVVARGLRGGDVVSEAAARVEPGAASTPVRLTLGPRLADGDGDDLPDLVDPCPSAPGPCGGTEPDAATTGIDGGAAPVDGPGTDAPRPTAGPDAPRADGSPGADATTSDRRDAPPALLPLGGACREGSACESGLCADGVCCDGVCTGACRSCAIAGSVGRCRPVPAGMDPRQDCTEEGAATCRRDGTCDGAGRCRLYVKDTPCAPATCQAGRQTPVRTCDGAGVCAAPAPAACGAYVCGATACKTACAGPLDCAQGYSCTGGVCVQGCTAQLGFEDGTIQGATPAPCCKLAAGMPASSADRPYCGRRALLVPLDFDLAGDKRDGEIQLPLPTGASVAGKTITYRVFLAGDVAPASPIWAHLFGGGYEFLGTIRLTVGEWSTGVVTVPAGLMFGNLFLQLIPTAAIDWSGTLYLDDLAW
jgi:hypothetical protein